MLRCDDLEGRGAITVVCPRFKKRIGLHEFGKMPFKSIGRPDHKSFLTYMQGVGRIGAAALQLEAGSGATQPKVDWTRMSRRIVGVVMDAMDLTMQ